MNSSPVAADDILEIPLSQLTIGVFQPRKKMLPEAIESLADSIRVRGVLQPILVRPFDATRFEIVAGERRFLASQKVGKRTIPAVVRKLSDQDALEIALTENLKRQDLTEIEEAEGILRLLAMRLELTVVDVIRILYRMENELKGKVSINESNQPKYLVITDIFRSVGKLSWQSFIVTRLPLLKLPSDVQEALRDGRITPVKARILARIKISTDRKKMTDRVAHENLSVQQLRLAVAQLFHFTTRRSGNELFSYIERFSGVMSKSDTWSDETRYSRALNLILELKTLIKAEYNEKIAIKK